MFTIFGRVVGMTSATTPVITVCRFKKTLATSHRKTLKSWRGGGSLLDASIDAASTAEILAYLNTNASHRKFETTTKPILRITETRWFQSQHDEVPNRLWKDPRVKSASNCAACHTKADSGNFKERFVHLPR